jgi:hypothetical protein
MFNTIGNIIKVVLFFLNLWREKDKEKAEAKKKVADQIVNAFKQTDKAKRASRLNRAVSSINRM